MSNLIDRQQAIDALKEAFNPSITNFVKAKMAIDNLPSAQPEKRTEERTETHACDSISRQAAIKDAESWVAVDEYEKHLQKKVVEWLKELPPAQPEIVRCKDCKHRWTHKCMDSMPIEKCDLEQTFYDAEIDYCSLAERREVTT